MERLVETSRDFPKSLFEGDIGPMAVNFSELYGSNDYKLQFVTLEIIDTQWVLLILTYPKNQLFPHLLRSIIEINLNYGFKWQLFCILSVPFSVHPNDHFIKWFIERVHRVQWAIEYRYVRYHRRLECLEPNNSDHIPPKFAQLPNFYCSCSRYLMNFLCSKQFCLLIYAAF